MCLLSSDELAFTVLAKEIHSLYLLKVFSNPQYHVNDLNLIALDFILGTSLNHRIDAFKLH